MADVIRVSILGQLPGGEVWSINPVWHMELAGQSVSNAQVTAIAAAVNAIVVPTSLRLAMTPTSLITGCRVEARNLFGDLEALAEGTRIPSIAGTGANPHPGQTAIVCSLRSTFPGGRGRGRFYWPATGQAMDSATLRLSAGNVTSILSGFDTYLTAIEAAVTASVSDSHLVVWSRTANAVHAITRVMVGDVLDTQRRRRDSLAETYQELAFP